MSESVFEQKFAQWNKKLLDLSKRNRMLNYRSRKTGTFVLDGGMYPLFDELTGNPTGLFFECNVPDFDSFANEEEWKEQVGKIKEQTRKIEYIRKTVNSAFDEMGFNIGYIAFGLLKWYETMTVSYESPLVLVPVIIHRESRSDPFYVLKNEHEDIQINPVIAKKLLDDFGIAFDENLEINDLQSAISHVQAKINGQPRWEIKDYSVLDTFNFQNLVIQKDLERNKEAIANNPFIKALTSSGDEKLFESYNEELDLKKIPPREMLQILDADSSQQEAIFRAQRGDSFVLQGPPGTGKSQTITNIIGDQLGRGKRVLFVSEKQAALDVVYHKLSKLGLADYCLSLHNIKQKKSDIRNQLQESLNLSSKVYQVKKESWVTYDKLKSNIQFLDDYDAAVHSEKRKFEQSYYYLHGKLAPLLSKKNLDFSLPKKVLSLNVSEQQILFNKVEDLAESYMTSSQRFLNNNWKHLKSEFSLGTQSEIKDMIQNFSLIEERLIKAEDEMNAFFPIHLPDNEKIPFIESLEALANEKNGNVKQEWYDFDLAESQLNINKVLQLRNQIRSEESKIEKYEKNIEKKFEPDFLEKQDVDQTIKMLKYEYKSFMKRLLSSQYKKVFKENKYLTKDLQLSYEELVRNLEELSNRNSASVQLIQLKNELFESELSVLNELNLTTDELKDISESRDGVIWLQRIKETIQSTHDSTNAISKENIVKVINGERIDWQHIKELTNIYLNKESEMNSYRQKFKVHFDVDAATDSDKSKFLDELKIETWREYFDYKEAKDVLIDEFNLEDFIGKVEENEVAASDILDIFCKRYYILLLDSEPEYTRLRNLSRNKLEVNIDRFKQEDRTTFSLARDRIIQVLQENLPSMNESIKVTGGEIGILKRELAKKSRLMPTRKLIGSLPTLLPRLKPCIMMSPVTVSTYFSNNENWNNFDLVIFDEASQVKIEYAIAAISRGNQIIVAGDSKQMPPTSFFDSSSEDEELEEELVDLESILDELSVKIPAQYLDWHYRSKDESLISFSNIKFYDNRLSTFPSNASSHDSNVKFSYVENGIWESKYGNTVEAEKVADLVFEHIKVSPDKSLGIVAFGMSQARIIEEKVLQMRDLHPEFEEFFDENKSEPFFVKNLENVQGDERDVIFLSVGYGRDSKGTIRMNFGPLTSSGGERRLNVAVSRSRETMHVISSMKSTDIRIADTNNENRIIFRDFLEYAEKGVGALLGYDFTNDNKMAEFDSPFEEDVYDFLKRKGYKLHIQVGASGYRIDMAVIHPAIEGRYVLAIECDGAAYHSSKTARDRDRLRQEVLETKGWKFYRIWSTSWINDNSKEKEALVAAVNEAISSYSENSRYSPTTHFESEVGTSLEEVAQFEADKNLPHYGHTDVYSFKRDLAGLSEILTEAAKRHVGYTKDDLMRFVNKEVFSKSRLTQGYREVYEEAFEQMERKEIISFVGNVIEKVRK